MARPAGHPLNIEAFDDILELKGLTITDLAELADEPRPTLSALRGGHNRASVPKAHKIAAALGCRVGTIFPTLCPRFTASIDERKAEAA